MIMKKGLKKQAISAALLCLVSVLLAVILYQRVQIWRLHRSVDCFMGDLEEEQLLRIAENTINRKLHEEELTARDKRIALLEKALEGSERKRKELCVRYWEDFDNG